MKIYFDENFPYQIAKALNILQSPKEDENVEVVNISDYFGRGAADEMWIPQIAKLNGIVVTQDLRIQNTHHQRDLYREHKLGVVFFKPPSKKGYTYWEQVEKVILSWKEIKNTDRQKRPFAFVIRPNSKHLEPL